MPEPDLGSDVAVRAFELAVEYAQQRRTLSTSTSSTGWPVRRSSSAGKPGGDPAQRWTEPAAVGRAVAP
ncbi:hypothetical protein FHU38_005221 [Saccharomonospora amisosensis]|uniref:Uncharacterized protein n=1 Tax=Saccharomonospora amisosensis TaxID=1128677 RepID=A0A7X5ZTC2_9PSEU|nr:hypothetical protein [Saccharomonospora amisosensis]NIJ14813.1 hypothetical protein [Saccharomonospora amisosensis]